MAVEQQQAQRPFRRKFDGVFNLGKRVSNIGGGIAHRVRRRLPGYKQQTTQLECDQSAVHTAGPEQRLDLLASIRGMNPFAQRQSPTTLSCFPVRFCQSSGIANAQTCQELLSVGTRLWGFGAAQNLLRVKIYEFAVYMDGQQAKQSKVKRKYSGRATGAVRDANFYRELRSSGDIDMSLMVRASRNLPITLLHSEYEKILKRRIQRVGGAPTDAALEQLLECFREENIPETIREGDCVKKGTVLVFRRDGAGRLRARANEHELADVTSSMLCRAVFDLYLGDQPVSRKAKRAAGESFFKLDGAQPYEAPQDALVCPQPSSSACLAAV